MLGIGRCVRGLDLAAFLTSNTSGLLNSGSAVGNRIRELGKDGKYS